MGVIKMAIFNWDYMSFYDFDSTWLYREVVLIPILLALLWIIWMKVVRNSLKEAKMPLERAMSLEEAYANAVISDALDTDDEAEVDETKKSDLNAEPAAEVEVKKDL